MVDETDGEPWRGLSPGAYGKDPVEDKHASIEGGGSSIRVGWSAVAHGTADAALLLLGAATAGGAAADVPARADAR